MRFCHYTYMHTQTSPSSIFLFLLHPTDLYDPLLLPPTFLRSVPHVSNALRAEFARGDGRIKRKEDERRKVINPSETLFVVNFNESTTTRENLQMLFESYGEIVRIDMNVRRAKEQSSVLLESLNHGE